MDYSSKSRLYTRRYLYTEESNVHNQNKTTLRTMRLCILPNTLECLASIRLGLDNDIEMSRHLLSQVVLQDARLVL